MTHLQIEAYDRQSLLLSRTHECIHTRQTQVPFQKQIPWSQFIFHSCVFVFRLEYRIGYLVTHLHIPTTLPCFYLPPTSHTLHTRTSCPPWSVLLIPCSFLICFGAYVCLTNFLLQFSSFHPSPPITSCSLFFSVFWIQVPKYRKAPGLRIENQSSFQGDWYK